MTTVAENETTTGSVPLIPLTRRRNYSPLGSDHFDDFDTTETSYHGASHPKSSTPFNNMARGRQQLFATMRPQKGSMKSSIAVASSYVFDWCIIIAILGVAYYLNGKAPNRRPFSLEDPNIS